MTLSKLLVVLAALFASILSFAPAAPAQPQDGRCTYHGSVVLGGGEFVVTAETQTSLLDVPQVIVTIDAERDNDVWTEYQYAVETPATTVRTAWITNEQSRPLLGAPINHGQVGGMFEVTVKGRSNDGGPVAEASTTFFARQCTSTTMPRRSGWAYCKAGGYSMSVRWARVDFHNYRIDEVRYLSAAGLNKTAATWDRQAINPVVAPVESSSRDSVRHRVSATAGRTHVMSTSVWVGRRSAETCLLDFGGSTNEPTVSTQKDNFMVKLGWWIWLVNNQ